MSQAKDASAAGRGQIRLPDDNESINLEAIALQKTRYGPAFFRRTGMILAYIALCAGAFLVVGHYKSSDVGGHLPPVRDLRIARPPARLHSEELVYDDDPMSAVFANSDNCNTTEAERWEFVDAGCGHGFTRGKERFSNSATKRFMLPVGEEQDIRLSARGNAHVSGVAHIVLAEDVEQKDVQVDVTFYMHDRKMFEEVMKVCRPTGPLALLGEQLSIQTVCTNYLFVTLLAIDGGLCIEFPEMGCEGAFPLDVYGHDCAPSAGRCFFPNAHSWSYAERDIGRCQNHSR